VALIIGRALNNKMLEARIVDEWEYKDGEATISRFNYTSGITVDNKGNL